MADFSEQQIQQQMGLGLSREGAIANLITSQQQGNVPSGSLPSSKNKVQTGALTAASSQSFGPIQPNPISKQVGGPPSSQGSGTTIFPTQTAIGAPGNTKFVRQPDGSFVGSRPDTSSVSTRTDFLFQQAMARHEANPTRFPRPIINANGTVSLPNPGSPEPPPSQKVTIGSAAANRPLSGSEFEQARKQLGAFSSNFDQFFKRDGQGNIFLKKEAAQELQERQQIQSGALPAGKDSLTKPIPVNGERLLGPTEFKRLREQLGVSDANFDQFFRRDELGNIFFKESSFAKEPEAVFSASLSPSTVSEFSSSILEDSPLTFPDAPEIDFEAHLRSLQALFEKTETERQKQLQANEDRLNKLFEKQIESIGDFPGRLEELRAEFQIPQKFNAIEELSLEIQKINSEFDNLIFGIEGQTIPISVIRGQQGRAIEKKALVLGAKQGTLQAMLGNFELANSLVQQTIDLEFASLESQINGTRELLSMNEASLSKEESKQAEQINFILDLREQAIKEQKEDKDFVKNLMLEIASVGGDPRGIDFNKSVEENMAVFGQQMDLIIEEQRKQEIEQAKALAGSQLIFDNNGKPVAWADSFNEEIVRLGGNNYISSIGPVTGYGSYDENGEPIWEWGLDVDLEIGDPLGSPVGGYVSETVLSEEGFGNQVKIIDDNGNEVWFSHLQTIAVQETQRINPGELIGTGGNSGFVIPGQGGDGSHLDITIVRPDGETFMSPFDVERYLNDQARSLVPEFANTQPDPLEGVNFGETSKGGLSEKDRLAQEEKEREKTQEAEQQKVLLEEKNQLIDSILSNPSLNSMVGPIGVSRLALNPFEVSERRNFAAEIQQLVDQETVDKLISIKQAGGTFGQLNEKELQIIKNSASKINAALVKDGDGQATGEINLSEEDFKKELKRMKDAATATIGGLDSLTTEGVLGDAGFDSEPSAADDSYVNSILGQ